MTFTPGLRLPILLITLVALVLVLAAQSAQAQNANDYDTDNDGLIEITYLEQLDALRWDLDGDGSVDPDQSTNATSYTAAFPDAVTGMGCPNAGCTGYELANDLDFTSTGSYRLGSVDTDWVKDMTGSNVGWEPIGDNVERTDATRRRFTGTFDGNEYAIANLYINRDITSSASIGLFGRVVGAVSDLTLTNVDVTGGSLVGALAGVNHGPVDNSASTGAMAGGKWVGGLVGVSVGDISDSSAAVVVSFATGSTVENAGQSFGGLVGYQLAGEIRDSHATGAVASRDFIGGLVGTSDSDIVDSYATGAVTMTGLPNLTNRESAGGLVGLSQTSGTIRGSYATGTVKGNIFAGGLVGFQEDDAGAISDSYATGDVTGLRAVGGLAGSASDIQGSYATGNVTATDHQIGGLVGLMTALGPVSESYATGNVTGGNLVGGLLGISGVTVQASYATGNVMATGPLGQNEQHGAAGGLIGKQDRSNDPDAITVRASYATGTVNGPSYVYKGGLIGQLKRYATADTISANYWDTTTSGLSQGLGTLVDHNGDVISGTQTGITGKTTTELQTPNDYNGIYAAWNVGSANPWRFSGCDYPRLSYETDVRVCGSPHQPVVSSTPRNEALGVSWTEPDQGDSTITAYTIQWKLATEIWGNKLGEYTTGLSQRSYVITGLTNDTEYIVRVRATNSYGDGVWSAEVARTPVSGPSVGTVTAGMITQTTADVEVTIKNADGTNLSVHFRHKRSDATTWTILSPLTTTGASVTFHLNFPTGNTGYRVQASLDSNFASGVVTATFTPLPTDPGWSAILTAGKRTTHHSGFVFSIGCDNIAPYLNEPTIKSCSSSQALTDDDFTYAGRAYSITKLVYTPDEYDQDNDQLEIVLAPYLKDVAKNLTLVVGGTRLDFADADHIWNLSYPEELGNRTSIRWNDPGFSWSYQQTVLLSLSEPDIAATLTDLAVKHVTTDLKLSPAFDHLETSYNARVTNGTTRVTVTPTPIDSSAMVEYLDAADSMIADADGGTTGHQVDLDVGDNTIKVRVTAGDGMTTKTYTVAVYREAQDAFWSATLTAGGTNNLTGCHNDPPGFFTGPRCDDALTDDDFTHDGRTYSFDVITYSLVDSSFGITVKPGLTDSDLTLTLVVDGEGLALDGADDKMDTTSFSDRSWESPGFNWSDGDTVTLELRYPPPEVTLVGNTDTDTHTDEDFAWQPGGPMSENHLIRTQAFTTGYHAAEISSIGLQFNGFPGGTNPEAELKATLNDDGPFNGRRAGAVLCTLGSPERDGRFITYHATADCPQLKPETKYRFVLSWQDVGDYKPLVVDRTSGPDENADSVAGWTIANSRHLYYWDLDNNTRYWRTDTGFSLLIEINGYEIESSLSVPPVSPTNFHIFGRNAGELGLSWDTPADDGGSDINGYTVVYQPTGGKPAGQDPFGTRNVGGDDTRSVGKRSSGTGAGDAPEGGTVETTDTSVVITGLTDGVEYEVRVIAHNEVGSSPPSDPVTGTPGETTEPLEAEFPPSAFSSRSHSGAGDSPQVVVAFSRPVASFTASTPSVSVGSGTVTGVQVHEELGLENAWLFFIDPQGNDDIEFSLAPDQPCDAGGICAEDGTLLSVVPVTHTIPGSAAQNTPATGAPTISGTAQVGETLTAVTDGIVDLDGLTNPTYSYKWIADDAEITGADGSNYTLADADESKAIKVRVSFTDDEGNAESLTSEAAGPDPGPITGFTVVASSDQSVQGTLADGGTLALDDPDGGSYGIRADLESGETIGSMRLQLTGAKTRDQTENIMPYSLYGDSGGNLSGESLPVGEYTLTATAYSEARLGGNVVGTLEVSFKVTGPGTQRPNSPATGLPTITGTARVGETLEAVTDDIADADGPTSPTYSYQWLSDGVEIAGANSSAYTLVAADEDKTIKVRVSFADAANNAETLTSAATAAVAAEPAEPTEPLPKPANLTARVNSDGSITLSWDAPDDDSVTGYRILRRLPTEGEDTLLVYVSDTGSTATTYTDTNVTAGVRHVYRVKAINSAGVGPRSNYVNPTP